MCSGRTAGALGDSEQWPQVLHPQVSTPGAGKSFQPVLACAPTGLAHGVRSSSRQPSPCDTTAHLLPELEAVNSAAGFTSVPSPGPWPPELTLAWKPGLLWQVRKVRQEGGASGWQPRSRLWAAPDWVNTEESLGESRAYGCPRCPPHAHPAGLQT